MLLTAHTTTFDPGRLASALARTLRVRPATVESGDLGITRIDGRRLELGAFARAAGAA